MKNKKLCLLLLVIIMALFMIGCHGTLDGSDDDSIGLAAFVMPEEFDDTKDYELTFWAKNDSNNTQKKVYENAVTAFEAIYPNISITIRSFTNYEDIYNEVITNIATSTTPNVCIAYPDNVATYLEGKNIVVPLDDLYNNTKYGLGGNKVKFDSVSKDEVVSKYLEEGYFKGAYYTMPFMRSSEACYINKDYVESLGYTIPNVLTWDWMWEVAEKAMTEKESNQTLIPIIYKSTDNMMIQMLKQKGANYSTDDGDILLFNEDTKEILSTIATHAETGCFSTFGISSYPGNFFNANQCIFAIDSTAGATWIGSNSPLSDISDDSIVDFETVVRTVPQYDIDSPQMISQGPSVCIFNKKNNQEVLASWLFMQYLLTNDTQINYSRTEGYVPVTIRAQESSEYLDYLSRSGENYNEYYDVKINATKIVLENTDYTFVTPVFNGSSLLRNAAGSLIEKVVRSVRKGETIDDDYYVALKEKVISLYKLDEIGNDEENDDKLSNTAISLIVIIVLTWVILITYVSVNYFKNKRKNIGKR